MKDERPTLRHRYSDAMRSERFTHPRTNILSHAMQWYLDGHLLKRPTVAIYSLGNLAEYMLATTNRGTRGDRARPVVRFFLETRRAMRIVMKALPVGARTTPKLNSYFVKLAESLLEYARAADADRNVKPSTARCTCPACRGSRTLPEADASLLEAILVKGSEAGLIPKTSKLYRNPVDKSPAAVI